MPSERVSRERREAVKAAIDEQALEAAAKALYTSWLGGPGAACMEPWDDDDEDDEADYQDVARNDVRTAITAYLAATPPERHDAPGVSRDDAEEMLDLYDTAPNKEYLTKYRELIINALTGSPDAGRDPDAADAGGEN